MIEAITAFYIALDTVDREGRHPAAEEELCFQAAMKFLREGQPDHAMMALFGLQDPKILASLEAAFSLHEGGRSVREWRHELDAVLR